MSYSQTDVNKSKNLVSGDYRKCIDAALDEAELYRLTCEQRRTHKYAMLQMAYEVYLHCQADRAAEVYFYKSLTKWRIRYTKATTLALAVVKALLHLSAANASKYGLVLTYAAHKQMSTKHFGTKLKEDGIQRLATRAAAELPVKPGSGKKKAKAPHPPGSGTGGTKKATYSPAGQSGSRSDSPSDSSDDKVPELEWAAKAQRIWDDAEPGSRLRLVIKKESDDEGLVVKAKCLEDA